MRAPSGKGASADKPRSVEITARVLNLDPAVISRVYDEQIGIFTSDGRFDPKALAVLRRSLVEMGLLPTEPDDAVMLTTRFLPVKLVEPRAGELIVECHAVLGEAPRLPLLQHRLGFRRRQRRARGGGQQQDGGQRKEPTA